MSFAAQWPGATDFDPPTGSETAAAADACLALLVRQWLSLSEDVDGPTSLWAGEARAGWPAALELAAVDGVLVAPAPQAAPTTAGRLLPRRHRRARARLDSWLAAAIQADHEARDPSRPLVARLKTSGLQFVAFSTTKIPDDVKELCQEIVELSCARPTHGTDTGRHRA